MAHQRYEETEKIVKKIAKHNKTEDKLPEDLVQSLVAEQEEKKKDKKYTFLDILQQPRLRIASFILFFVWSIGVGVCSTSGRVGAILAPIILILRDYWEPLPLVAFATLEVIATCLILLLPETRGKMLTATFSESEDFLRHSLIGKWGRSRKEDIELKEVAA